MQFNAYIMNVLQRSIFWFLAIQIFWATTVRSQYTKICVTNGFEAQCDQLERESPNVKCVRVQDSIECAKTLRNGSTGFGIFSAESMLLLATLKYDGLTILKELRHRDRLNHTVDFESVVIVRSTHSGGIKGLKGLKYCHPGLYYDHTEKWSERFLKHFERFTTTPDCESPLGKFGSAAEIEVATLANFFGPACRPGAWSNNPHEDQTLKEKYPQLCELCSSKTSPCAYADTDRHIEALRCLVSKGDVAYVSLQEAHTFFTTEASHLRSQYAFLCPNNSIQSLDDPRPPCTWLRQPWPAVVATVYNSIELSNSLNRWAYSSYGWETAVKEILSADNKIPIVTTIQEPRSLFHPYREVPFHYPLCSTSVTWCTKTLAEKDKCEVIRAAGLSAGVYPLIECQEPVMGPIGCLKEVNEGRADLTVIDANYGYIARNKFNLTTALYGETDKPASAGIVIRATSDVTKMQDIAGVRACFNEFNGLPSLAFINNGQKIGQFQKSCNHSRVLANYFGSSCAPGASDPAHNAGEIRENLCSACPSTNNAGVSAIPTISTRELLPPDYTPLDQEVVTKSSLQNELDVLNARQNCNADQFNGFYGNEGALRCLVSKKGDVAILGLKDLNEHAKSLTIDPQYYKVICRNGTLADHTGFDVDDDCALATYVDSEVVIKAKSIKQNGIINALLSFDKYFQVDPDFKMYGKFDGLQNVLFKNGTVGLASFDEKDLGASVDNYKKLIQSVQACGRAFTTLPLTSILIAAFVAIITINRLRL